MIRVNPFWMVLFLLLIYSCRSANQNGGDAEKDKTGPADERKEQSFKAKSVKYASGNFNYSLYLPEDWEAEEYREEGPFPVINFFPSAQKGELDLPLTVHANATVSYIGIYPKGYGIELPMGDNRRYGGEYSLPLNFSADREESKVFLLENGEAWGYFIVPSSPPENWEDHGFLFLQIAVNDFEARCYDKETGEELNMQECDPMMGDTIKRFGNVRGSDRKMLEQMAESISLGTVNDNSNRNQKGPGASGIQVRRPDAGATVSSPVTIEGEARGNWYFEAEFTVDLVQDGETLTTAIVKAQDDWMTEEYVPFSATMEIPEAATEGEAQLVFRNSNPSGKPELDKSYSVPVKVEQQK